MAAWAAFMLPIMVMGAGRIAAESENDARMEASFIQKEEACAAAGPSSYFTGYAAEEVDYYEQPNFVRDYFRNLVEHFPTNNCGNCGYTAAAMLLCYYDTYWNGKIIPDQFNSRPSYINDVKDDKYSSPGIEDYAAPIYLDENVKKPDENSDKSEILKYNAYLVDKVYGPYLNEMRKPEILKFNLISYLYDLALGNNKSGTVLWDFGIYEPTTATNMGMVRDLLNLYFDELGLAGQIKATRVHYTDFKDPFVSSLPPFRQERFQKHLLREKAIEKLTEGQPIIYRGNLAKDPTEYSKDQVNVNGNGHAAIAYDFDEDNNRIIGHIGWKGENEYSMLVFEKSFDDFTDIIYLEVDPCLKFDYGNVRFVADGHDALACDLHSHKHADDDHRAKVSYGDPEYHALQCICGDVAYEEHCHDAIEPFDSQNHILKCACGDVRYEGHTRDETVWYDGLRHAYKCHCGHIVGTAPHFYVQQGLTKLVCKGCGDVRQIDPPFILNP